MLLRTIPTLLVMAGVFRLHDTAKLVRNDRVTLFSDTQVYVSLTLTLGDQTVETTLRDEHVEERV